MNLANFERILILKPSSLGDIVHALPAVESLHRTQPGAKLDWLVNSEWSPLLEGLPFLNRVIEFPRKSFGGIGGIFRAREWAKSQLATDYDLAVDFQGLLRTGLLAKSSGASEVAGFQQSREGASIFYTERVDVHGWSHRHAVERNLILAAAIGADTERVVFTLPAGDVILGADLESTPYVVLHPFSRGKGKSLSSAEVFEFCERLSPFPVVLLGMPDRPLDIDWPSNTIDLLGQTSIAQLIYALRKASWTVSIDSGPMHLAAGINDRVLSLHTWSNPATVGPWPPEAWVWCDSTLLRVKELAPDRFPERRYLRSRYESSERLFSPADIEAIADFVSGKVTP